MSELNLIDAEAFALNQQSLKGKFILSELDERVWLHEYFSSNDGEITYEFIGGQDEQQRLFLNLMLHVKLDLICQRCVKPLKFYLDDQVRIHLFKDEADLDEAMLADENLEGIVLEKNLNLRALIEDQIIMTLPFSPRHDDCNNPVLEKFNQSKPNSFTALQKLKTSK